MNNLKRGCLLSALLILLLGLAYAQEENEVLESEIAITNANMVATSPEKENLNMEWIEISNLGSADQSLEGWTLADQQKHTYTFQNFILPAGASVKVHTGCGDDSPTDLYYNRNNPIWNNNGDTATLRDDSGIVVASYPEE